jgi:hypothetical protein
MLRLMASWAERDELHQFLDAPTSVDDLESPGFVTVRPSTSSVF